MKRWPTKPLGRLVTRIKNGVNLKQEITRGGIPITRIETISDGVIDHERVRWVMPDETVLAEYSLRNGDILFSHINSPEHIGKTAIYEGIPEQLVHGINLLLLRPDPEQVSPRWLLWQLKSDTSREYFRRLCKRAINQASLNQGDLQGLAVCVPPLVEQERIVKLLDEADELRELRAQADCRTADLIPALFYEMFGDPSINAQDFPIIRIGELCETSPNYGTMVPARANEGEWLSLRVANIQDGLIDLTDQKFVDLPVEMLERHTVKDGDLLLARAIGSKDHLGKCIVARPGNQKWAFDSHLMRVRLDHQRCEPVWLKTLLDTSGGRQLFLNNTRQSAVQFNINTKEFASIVVPLPPVPQQKEFAARVSEIRAMQAEQATSRRRLDDLFQSMLHRAFQGEL